MDTTLNHTVDELFALFEGQTNLERSALGKTRAYRLERMADLLARFENPERAARVVHVAGSKGKGSTATMIALLIAGTGARVGLYTSPHLLDYRERIRVLDQRVEADRTASKTEQNLRLYGNRLWSLVEEAAARGDADTPTTFELLTALAFLVFRAVGCDWVVLETGLGGRLDATNVCLPVLSVITRIELEHTEYLGDTISAIAGEKAGIIKPHTAVLVAPQVAEAEAVFRATATQRNAPYLDVVAPGATPPHARWQLHSGTEIVLPGGSAARVRLPGVAAVQGVNVATAVAALRYLETEGHLPPNSDAHKAALLSQWRPEGRGEVYPATGERPLTILDGAHTPNSVAALFGALHGGGVRRCVVVFAAAEGKDVRGMVGVICTSGVQVVRAFVTRAGTFKRSEPRAAEAWRAASVPVVEVPTEEEAYRLAADASVATAGDTGAADASVATAGDPGAADASAATVGNSGAADASVATAGDPGAAEATTPVVVTGSFYLVAAIKRLLECVECR